MLSWTLELAVMLELRPSVGWNVKNHSSWIVWSNNPEREATLCFCRLAFVYFEMWGSVLLYNWFFHLIPLWMLSLSIGKSNWIKVVPGFFFSGLSKQLHVLLSCGCRGCDLARPPLGWCLHLRNFTCTMCPSVQGASCQNCRYWRWKRVIPLFIPIHTSSQRVL